MFPSPRWKTTSFRLSLSMRYIILPADITLKAILLLSDPIYEKWGLREIFWLKKFKQSD